MKGRFKHTALLALSLGIAAPVNTVWAETFLKIEGVDGEAMSLSLRSFPGNSFTETQLRQFAGQGITSARELIGADPVVVGRILGIDTRQAHMMQRHLREVMVER